MRSNKLNIDQRFLPLLVKMTYRYCLLSFCLIGLFQLSSCGSIENWEPNGCLDTKNLSSSNVLKIRSDTKVAGKWRLNIFDLKGICNEVEESTLFQDLRLEEIQSTFILIDTIGDLFSIYMSTSAGSSSWVIGMPLAITLNLYPPEPETLFDVNQLTLWFTKKNETHFVGQAFFGNDIDVNIGFDGFNQPTNLNLDNIKFVGQFELHSLD